MLRRVCVMVLERSRGGGGSKWGVVGWGEGVGGGVECEGGGRGGWLKQDVLFGAHVKCNAGLGRIVCGVCLCVYLCLLGVHHRMCRGFVSE